MNDMLTKHERLIALLRNNQTWSWDIYPEFTVEREDIEVFLPILHNHIFHHTEPSEDNKFVKLYNALMDVIEDTDRPSYKANQPESEIIQIVLGDFL